MQFFSELREKALKEVGNDDLYLTSFLANVEDATKDPDWTVNLYNPLEDNIYSYDSSSKEFTGPHEVFKEQDFIPELELEEVKIDFHTALKQALKEALPETEFTKIIAILQNIDGKNVWNFTLMNKSFHILNVRIDASNGNLLKKEPINLVEFESDKKE